MKILLVEDEQRLSDVLQRSLESASYAVSCSASAEAAIARVINEDFDLHIVDVRLPAMSGLELCKYLREKGITKPILILTARDSVSDKIEGLDSGADDYMTKPFEIDELLARVRALLRKGSGYQKPVLEIEDLLIDPNTRLVRRNGKEIELSKKEYALLEYLARNKDRLVTRQMISKAVWEDESSMYTNVIDVFINYLRKKVDADFELKLIHTVRGKGFKISANKDEQDT